MTKNRRTLSTLAATALLAAVGNHAASATLPYQIPDPAVSPPPLAEPDSALQTAQKKQKAKAGNKKRKRCANLRHHCEYGGNTHYTLKLCTAENVKFMRENCIDKK